RPWRTRSRRPRAPIGAEPPARSGQRVHARSHTLELADRGACAEVEVDLALEVERALHHRVRLDRHLRVARQLVLEPAAVLLDVDGTVHSRPGPDEHVAVDRLDVAADLRRSQRNPAVDVLDGPADAHTLLQGQL